MRRPQATARGCASGHEMPADPLEYAAALYDTLHRLDAQGLDWIAVEPTGNARVGRRARPAAPGGRGVVAGEGRRKRIFGSD